MTSNLYKIFNGSNNWVGLVEGEYTNGNFTIIRYVWKPLYNEGILGNGATSSINNLTASKKTYGPIKIHGNNTPIDEGLGKALLGGLAGATVGPAIMKAVCRVLGINETGPMGNLMTSRLVLTAMGGYLGWKN